MNNGLDLMQARLNLYGGQAQQDRMIKDKRKTFNKVVLYSYQGAKVKKIEDSNEVLALINPNITKQDYDDKIISVGYEYNFKPGTIFDWINTGTKWIVYLQDLTELAYFKGDIRKCNYEIHWKDGEDNLKSTFAAIRGPVETKMSHSQKEGISFDTPNYSLNILIPQNIDTLKQFQRYSKFYLQGNPTCWRIEATDTVSMPGIIEINAIEYYSNETEDNIQEGIVDDFVVQPIEPLPNDSEIEGEVFIKPKKSYKYKYTGLDEATWVYDKKLPIIANISGSEIEITWNTTYSGQFVLQCNDKEKTIVVESLF